MMLDDQEVTDEWIVRVQGAEYGPANIETLREWKAEGRLLPDNDGAPGERRSLDNSSGNPRALQCAAGGAIRRCFHATARATLPPQLCSNFNGDSCRFIEKVFSNSLG